VHRTPGDSSASHEAWLKDLTRSHDRLVKDATEALRSTAERKARTVIVLQQPESKCTVCGEVRTGRDGCCGRPLPTKLVQTTSASFRERAGWENTLGADIEREDLARRVLTGELTPQGALDALDAGAGLGAGVDAGSGSASVPNPGGQPAQGPGADCPSGASTEYPKGEADLLALGPADPHPVACAKCSTLFVPLVGLYNANRRTTYCQTYERGRVRKTSSCGESGRAIGRPGRHPGP